MQHAYLQAAICILKYVTLTYGSVSLPEKICDQYLSFYSIFY